MVVKFVQRVLPADSAKFGSVIGCVVAIRPLARFVGPCTAGCLRCAHPPSPKSYSLPARSPAYDSSPSVGVNRKITHILFLTLKHIFCRG
jgi:hypothetical protein